MSKELYLAVPRGFCAGVKRAISLVEKALDDFGTPIYVRHEIVHNKHVVADLEKRGVIFIDDFSEVKDTSRPVIISAHGAPASVYEDAKCKNLHLIDATCPLVAKVHRQIRKLNTQAAEIIVIGKKEHPEVIGTVGQIPNDKQIHIIYSAEEAKNLNMPENKAVGVVTQTTLAVDKTQKIIEILQDKFSQLITAHKNDICYATTHRQSAIKELVKYCDAVVIIGSQNSSNSQQLRQAALQYGASAAWLVDDVSQLPLEELKAFEKIGLSAGASAPEYLIDEVIAKFKEDYANIKIRDIIVAEENIEFKS